MRSKDHPQRDAERVRTCRLERLRGAGQRFCNPVPTTRLRVWCFSFLFLPFRVRTCASAISRKPGMLEALLSGAGDSPRAPSPASVRSPWGVCPTVSKPIPGGPRLLIHASLCAGHTPAVSSLCGGGCSFTRSCSELAYVQLEGCMDSLDFFKLF